jgi:hypothetical protein
MPIETSLAKKVTRFQNSNDCFLAPLGNDRELDLAPLDVKNRVRNVTLRKNNLILLIFRYCFSIANLGEKYLGIECGPVAGLVGIERGVVSGVINLESSDVGASDRRPRHDEQYHEL